MNLKILVGYDGSSNARKAVETVADMAKKLNAFVTVIHVVWEISDEEGFTKLLNMKRILDQADVKSEIRLLRYNDPAQIITQMAKDEDFDVIVVGSRGMGGIESYLLGSVSTKILQEAHCNVLIIKE